MSWKNVKNFLIILLVAVNILLLVFVYNYFMASRYTTSETAEVASDVLKQSGIYVDEELLAVENDSADTLLCTYDREHYLALVASLLFGKEADGIYMLPSGIRAETLDGESVSLGYDMSIDYTRASHTNEINQALANSKKAASEDTKAARELLEELIALPFGALDSAECTSYGEYTFITAVQTENGLPIYDMTCRFGIHGGKIVYAHGKHFFGVPEQKESTQLLNRVNIMFSEKERGEVGRVTDISLCYTLYEDSQNHSMMYIPSYRIVYEDGKINAVNAISKEKY